MSLITSALKRLQTVSERVNYMSLRERTILFIEAIAGVALTTFVLKWIAEPTGPYEAYAGGASLILGGLEACRRYQGWIFKTEGVKRSPSERIQHHENLRALFNAKINWQQARNLHEDVLIRHVNRFDSYPDVDDQKGVSPWFKVGLLDIYHAGIKVGLCWQDLVESPVGLCKPDRAVERSTTTNLMLIGEIPFDYIETMNTDGDEYYPMPHIYCHYANKGEPYARLYYAEKVEMGGGRYYWQEVISHEDVLKNTEKRRCQVR